MGGLIGFHSTGDVGMMFLGVQGTTMQTLADKVMSPAGRDIVDLEIGKISKFDLKNFDLSKSAPGNTIVNSFSSASVSGIYTVGGLVGLNEGLIELSYATGDVTLEYGASGFAPNAVVLGNTALTFAGGFVGENNSLIIGCYSTGNVTGGDMLGGFAGRNDSLIILNFASGNVTGDNELGGFVGVNNGGAGYGYARGSVSGVDGLGGFAGTNNESIAEVYSTGSVTGTGANIGGLIGGSYTDNVEDYLFNSFWDNETSGQSVGCGNIDCSSRVYGRSTNAMKLKPTFTTEISEPWGFDDDFFLGEGWGLKSSENDGYPYLLIFDIDKDGVLDSTENSGPNFGDANNDGTFDSRQMNVTSFINIQNNSPEVLEVSNMCIITNIDTQAESGLSLQDAGFNYPAGLTNFTVDCGAENFGYTADITLYFYDLEPTGLVLRKYNSNTSGYSTIIPSSLTQVTIGVKNATKVIYQVTEGGPLDMDGTVNGIIVDPVGLATNVVGVPKTGLGGGL